MTTLNRRRSDRHSVGTQHLRVLIVDDDLNYRAYIGALLKRFDFDIEYASDGVEAIAALEHATFDLLIIDCEMPRLDGMELIKQVRANRGWASIYALMLTAREDLDTKITALAAGFDDFIAKSTPDLEIAAEIGASRRLIERQRKLDRTVRELYGLATRDELTGLFNRRYFFGEADRLLKEGAPVNLVLFDLDRFKAVNDTYGHLAGDRILRDVGALFLARTRHQDIMARYGGDEFVLLMSSESLDEVEHLAARLSSEIAALEWAFGGEAIKVGATSGIASAAFLERPTISQLIETGDRDLYKNKWMRTHPDLDPSLYEYPPSRASEVSSLVEFRVRPAEEKLRESSE